MPEEPEIDANELRESIAGLQEEIGEEKRERDIEGRWIRYVALSTALLAVFAAIGALQSGALVNEAMIDQVKSSDTWSEYQASRQKEYFFSGRAEDLLDRGIAAPDRQAAMPTKERQLAAESAAPPPAGSAALHSQSPTARLGELLGRVDKEAEKQPALRERAELLEKESEHGLHRHHLFAWSVALIQVAIAMSAVAAITKLRPVWVLSLVIGMGGLLFFVFGLMPGAPPH